MAASHHLTHSCEIHLHIKYHMTINLCLVYIWHDVIIILAFKCQHHILHLVACLQFASGQKVVTVSWSIISAFYQEDSVNHTISSFGSTSGNSHDTLIFKVLYTVL